MKIKEIQVSYSMKHALPNYGSIQYHAGMSAEIGENESKEKVFQLLWLECKAQVLEQMAERLNHKEIKDELEIVNQQRKEANI